MEVKQMFKPAFVLMFLLFACESDPIEVVVGSEQFSTAGEFEFEITAKNVIASLVLVGGGGGGAGGVIYDSGNTSTGGGGGGGAGELKEFAEIHLQSNVTYTVVVGAGGDGGTEGSAGANGIMTMLKLNDVILFSAQAGSGGNSNSDNNILGGDPGFGFPAGQTGGGGEVINANGNAMSGRGGNGASNGTAFGLGGKGGDGVGLVNFASNSATLGNSGSNGYFRIEWRGDR